MHRLIQADPPAISRSGATLPRSGAGHFSSRCSNCRAALRLIVTGLAILAAACASTPPASDEPGVQHPDSIIALVNGTPIKYAEFKQELNSVYQKIHLSGQIIDGNMFSQLKHDVLESLIHLVLMDQYGRELGIPVDDGQVQRTFQAAVAQYPSENAFRDSIETAGLTKADILTRLRRNLTAQHVVKTRIKPNISVSDDDVKAYYESHPHEFEHGDLVHAAHILI